LQIPQSRSQQATGYRDPTQKSYQLYVIYIDI
jgi:hypothetical protein